MKAKFGATVELEQGSGGVFDVWVDGRQIWDKSQEGDFPKDAEIARRIKALPQSKR